MQTVMQWMRSTNEPRGMVLLAPNTVLVTTSHIRAFRASWPCSGLPSNACVSFEFDSNGLCDISWYTEEGIDVDVRQSAKWDSPALAALADDAKQFLAAQGGN